MIRFRYHRSLFSVHLQSSLTIPDRDETDQKDRSEKLQRAKRLSLGRVVTLPDIGNRLSGFRNIKANRGL
jgi:hypothetical protein